MATIACSALPVELDGPGALLLDALPLAARVSHQVAEVSAVDLDTPAAPFARQSTQTHGALQPATAASLTAQQGDSQGDTQGHT